MAKKAPKRKGRAATKKGRSRGGRRRIPWEEMRLRYVSEPDISLRKLAEEHGIDRRTVQKRASREDWEGCREKHVRKLVPIVRQKTATLVAQKLVEKIEQLAKIRTRILERFGEQLERKSEPDVTEETEQEVKESKDEGGGKTVSKRVIRRQKPLVDSKIVDSILKQEQELLDSLLRRSEDGGEGAGGTRNIEIT